MKITGFRITAKPCVLLNTESMLKYLTLGENGKFGAWCNGSTADFESVDLGSNPSAPARVLMKTKNRNELNDDHLARYFIKVDRSKT